MEPFRPSEKRINFGVDLAKNRKDRAQPTNYQLGAVSKEVLQPTGQWLDFAPECEIQKSTDGDDRMNCVSNSESNIKKILLKRQYNLDLNPSQRFRAKKSGTTRSGNSLFAVANSARKDGFVLNADWPENVNMGWTEYYRPIPSAVTAKGLKSVLQFDVNYEYVPLTSNALKEALKYAPVQVIGYAWAEDSGIYYDHGYRPNHAFVLVGYKPNGNWLVYDSYPTDFLIDNNSTKQEYIKELDKNFKFGDAMLFTIKLRATDKRSWLYKIIMALKNLKMNFWVNKNDHSKGMANGEVYITKDGKKKKVDDINDIMAILEMNFGIEKTDWGELGNYQTVDRF